MTERGKCRSCGADILWTELVSAKGNVSRHPLNANAEKRIVLLPDPETGTEHARIRDTFTSHFATCPSAAQHRKPKEST